jgi:hypothetical protein
MDTPRHALRLEWMMNRDPDDPGSSPSNEDFIAVLKRQEAEIGRRRPPLIRPRKALFWGIFGPIVLLLFLFVVFLGVFAEDHFSVMEAAREWCTAATNGQNDVAYHKLSARLRRDVSEDEMVRQLNAARLSDCFPSSFWLGVNTGGSHATVTAVYIYNPTTEGQEAQFGGGTITLVRDGIGWDVDAVSSARMSMT